MIGLIFFNEMLKMGEGNRHGSNTGVPRTRGDEPAITMICNREEEGLIL